MGVGAIIGGYISGFLSDKLPIMKVGKSSFLVLGICMFLSLPIFL
jgi:predicted MFS family arabinose efflux permease